MSSDERYRERLHKLGIAVLAAGHAREWSGTIAIGTVVAVVSSGGWKAIFLALLVLALVTVTAAIVGLLEWRALTFGVEQDSFVLRLGVIRRRTVDVPLSRVQSVDVNQNAAARLLGYRELTVRTAAGTANVHLPAVSASAEARLRAALGGAAPAAGAAPAVVRTFPARSLPLLAVTSPRIGAAAGVISVLIYRLDDLIPGSLVDWAQAVAPHSLLGAAAEVAVALLLAVAVSLLGTVLTWWGFRMVSDGKRLRVRHGLLNVRETVVPLDRIRSVEVREGLPRQALGLCSVWVNAAGRATRRAQRAVIAPLTPRDEAAALVAEVVPGLRLDGIPLRRPPVRARGRAIRRSLLPAAILAGAACILFAPTGALALLLLAPAAALGDAQWRAAAIGLEGGRLGWREREIARRSGVAHARSVQWRRIRQSPRQRRRGFATLSIGLAAGGSEPHVRDLELDDAAALARALGPQTV